MRYGNTWSLAEDEILIAEWGRRPKAEVLARLPKRSEGACIKHACDLRKRGIEIPRYPPSGGRPVARGPMNTERKKGAMRSCMTCGLEFLSRHRFHRICGECKNNEAFRVPYAEGAG